MSAMTPIGVEVVAGIVLSACELSVEILGISLLTENQRGMVDARDRCGWRYVPLVPSSQDGADGRAQVWMSSTKNI